MRVFTDCDRPGRADESLVLRQAANVLDRFGRRQDGHWSLCEVGCDREDYDWLLGWAGSLDRVRTAHHLRSTSDRPRFGLLFLLHATETCRRTGSEDHVWPAVSAVGWPAGVRPLLFDGTRYPRQDVRDAIEDACRQRRLRHAFDDDGVMAWFATVGLQFGFTRRGYRDRLGDWLDGHGVTNTTRRLLAGPDRSESFARLWADLKHYRRGDLEQSVLRRRLEACPWVLPDWLDDLVRLAGDRPAATTHERLDDRALTEACAIPAASGPPPGSRDFVRPPLLRWPPGDTPSFEVSLDGDAIGALALDSPSYSLFVAGRRAARLLRGTEGYRLDPRPALLAFPDPGICAVTLVGDDGTIVASQEVQFWDPREDVAAFDLGTGRPVDAWGEPLTPGRAYALLIASDLAMNPGGDRRRVAPGFDLARPPSAQMTDWSIRLGGEAFWTPFVAGRPQPPPWTRQVDVSFTDGVGTLLVTHPDEVEVRFVRAGAAVGFVNLRPGRTTAGPVGRGDSPATRFAVRVGLSGPGGSAIVVRSLATPAAPLRLGEAGWTPLKADELSRQDLADYPVSVPEPREAAASWAVMEGDVMIDRPGGPPRPLSGVSGWGAPLTIRRGPRNRPPDDEDRLLVRSVVDHGAVADFDFDPRRLRITTRYRLDPGPDHEVVALDDVGRLYRFPANAVAVSNGAWEIEAPAALWFGEPAAVAVAYRGHRIGASWSRAWCKSLTRPREGFDPGRAAAAVRWFKLPVSNPGALAAVASVAAAHPADVLDRWIFRTAWEDEDAEGLPFQLVFPDADEGWLAVVRRVFEDIRIDKATADALEAAAAADLPVAREGIDSCPLGPLVVRLGRLPLLMAEAVDAFTAGSPREREALVCFLAKFLASGVPTDGSDWDEAYEAGLIEIAKRVRSRRPVLRWERENLEAGLANEGFRRRLAISLLKDLAGNIPYSFRLPRTWHVSTPSR